MEIRFRTVNVQTISQYINASLFIKEVSDILSMKNSTELYVNRQQSRPDCLNLQSATSSTTVQILPHQLMMNTNFFDEYEVDENFDRRNKYYANKINALTEVINEVTPLAITTLAVLITSKLKVDPIDAQKLKDAFQKAFLKKQNQFDLGALFDFHVRLCYHLNDDFFVNAHLSWYQERAADVSIHPENLGRPLLIPIWDMDVIEEGIEIKYEINNRNGLFKKKTNWNFSRIQEETHEIFILHKNFIDKVKTQLESQMA